MNDHVRWVHQLVATPFSVLYKSGTRIRRAVSCFAVWLTTALIVTSCAAQAHPTEPLKVLLITGGCCHDYASQQDILKKGLEERSNVVVTQVHSADDSTRPPLAILGHPNYANGFDLVIHDECASDINDPDIIQGVLKPHLDGLPGVNLHCANHSYRIGDPNDPVVLGSPHGYWFEYLGVQSSAHGLQAPIAITYVDPASSITKGLSNWTTTDEELYNNIHVFDNAHVIVRGKQVVTQQNGSVETDDFVVAWTNEYGPNHTRVFSTTIGHSDETVADPRYLDLVTRGVLWATGHLQADGHPAKGYGPGGK
jgi:Trehalose utilisation